MVSFMIYLQLKKILMHDTELISHTEISVVHIHNALPSTADLFLLFFFAHIHLFSLSHIHIDDTDIVSL